MLIRRGRLINYHDGAPYAKIVVDQDQVQIRLHHKDGWLIHSELIDLIGILQEVEEEIDNGKYLNSREV